MSECKRNRGYMGIGGFFGILFFIWLYLKYVEETQGLTVTNTVMLVETTIIISIIVITIGILFWYTSHTKRVMR